MEDSQKTFSTMNTSIKKKEDFFLSHISACIVSSTSILSCGLSHFNGKAANLYGKVHSVRERDMVAMLALPSEIGTRELIPTKSPFKHIH